LDGKSVTTITGVVGVNVICVKDVILSGKQVTLTGPAGAEFIIKVRGKFVLTGGGQGPRLRVAGGVLPKDVLYNIIGAGSDVAFSGGGGGGGCCKAIVDGTLLAPLRKIRLSPGLVNGHINWAPVTGNTIQFTIQNAFRRSFLPSVAYECIDPATVAPDTVPTIIPCSAADGLPGPGDVFAEDIGSTQFFPGDGSVIDSPLAELLYVVTSIDPVNEWLFALALDPASLPAIDTTITHTYPAAGNF